MCLGGADADAFSTRDAAVGEVLEFLIRMPSFRVMAPEAPHCASFQEDRGADARAVVDGEPLDMKDEIFAQ
jgi:hypothetical protein